MSKKISSFLLLPVFLTVGISLFAQSGSLRKANKEYELHAYNRAIESYLAYLERRPDETEAMANLADCYRYVNEMEQAARWYRQAVTDKKIDPIHLLNYGLVLKALQQYDEARYMFQRYAQEKPAVGGHYAETCNFAVSQLGNPSVYQVASERINTPSSEFGPSFYGEQVVFSSARVDIQRSRANFNNRPSNQLFIARMGSDGFLESPRFLREDQDGSFSEGPVSFSSDGRTVVYTRNNFVDGTRHIPGSGMSLSLYFAEVNPSNGDWFNEEAFPYNGSGYSTGFARFSPDGNALYFASDRPGGFGGYDIYVCYRTGNTWGTPENLGTIVNSPGNEVTPYFDGNNLFFSSDWHAGLGGYDIFRAEQSNGRYSRIVHLGVGVNSSRDDYDFVYDRFRNNGYMTSNRGDGRGNGDIYRVYQSADRITLQVKNASDGAPIADAIVDFSDCGEGMDRTGRDGVYSFQAVEGLNCELVISKEGYRSASLGVSTLGLQREQTYNIMLVRRGEEYYGNVVDYRTNRPLEGVLINSTNQRIGSSMETTTGPNGDYTLALTPESIYIVRYSRQGYRDVNRTVQLNDPANRSMLGTVSMVPANMSIGPVEGPVNPGSAAAQAGSSASTVSSGYAVQVAAIGQPALEPYDGLRSLGTVYAKEENGLYKVRIGVFSSRGEANSVLQNVKRQGYRGAFIVQESGGEAESMGVKGATESVSTATSGSLGRYMIQLGAYGNPRFFDAGRVQDYGVIEDRRRGNLTIKLLAGYDTMSEARRALSFARSSGFPDAFIVEESNGGLRKVE